MIQQVAYRRRRHTFLLDQVENDARIEVAATATHWQAIECGEAHGRCHTLASVHRTHAGAAAEMGDHHATIRFCRTKDIRKNAGDVFIRKDMKPVPPDTIGRELTRQREGGGYL